MTRTLGKNGPDVSSLGLGAMGMSDFYGPADRAESIATIRAALDAGVTLIDTGDFYGSGHNELLIREALAGRNCKSVVISVKFGALRDPAGGWGGIDNSPAALRNFLAQSLQRLGTGYIDIYRPARLDPKVPIEDTIGAMAEMVAAGYIRHIGLSEVSAQTIRKAHAVHPISDLQIEYSLISREASRTAFCQSCENSASGSLPMVCFRVASSAATGATPTRARLISAAAARVFRAITSTRTSSWLKSFGNSPV